MTYRILETTPAEIHDLLSSYVRFIIRDIRLAVTFRWDVWDCHLTVQDITHAGKAGKTCPSIHYEFKHAAHNGNEGTHAAFALLKSYDNDLHRLYMAGLSLPWQPTTYHVPPIPVAGGVAYLHTHTAVRTFSPFASYNRLTEAPKKWTVAHVIRALWNGQFKQLKCDGQYTDDYAGDAARKFGVGEISDGRAFAKKLIEHPSGWWASAGRGEAGVPVSICCHHFDSNSFIFDVAGTREEGKSTAPAAVAA